MSGEIEEGTWQQFRGKKLLLKSLDCCPPDASSCFHLHCSICSVYHPDLSGLFGAGFTQRLATLAGNSNTRAP